MKQNRLIILFLCSIIPCFLYAENEEQSLVILMKSGTRISIPITEQPKIVFEENVITVGGISYQLENVQKWLVGDPETVGIEDIVTVTPHEKGAQAKVFNAAGVEMPAEIKTDQQGRLQCNLKKLPSGVYVIQVGKETFKVSRK